MRMLSNLDSRILFVISLVLLLTGFSLPLLMVLKILQSTLFLNFFAYGALTLGTLLGLIAAMTIASKNWHK
jgi:multisubunit Na+/H+ antiporter MnhC subunit